MRQDNISYNEKIYITLVFACLYVYRVSIRVNYEIWLLL